MRSLIPPAILALGLGCAEQSAPPPASPAAPAEAPAAAADTAQRALTAALPEARDIPTLRRDYAPTLPAATAADRAALTAQSQDPAAAPAARVAATIALGAEVAPETSRALRAALDATMKQITTAARPTTTDAVRVAAAVWPLVGDRVEALPPIVRAALDAPTPGEGRAWTEATAAAPLPPLGPAEVPYLTRHAVAPTPNASWLARLLLAGIDDPRATDALLHLPPARYGDPGSDRDLAEWALTLHATLPAARARITRALDPATPARARDRAAAALAPHREPAAIDAITALLDRVAAAPQGPDRDPPIALGPLIDEAAAWADPRLLTALARYGQSDAPHRVRARRAAEAAGQAPDKAALLDRLDRDPTDDRARQALPPSSAPPTPPASPRSSTAPAGPSPASTTTSASPPASSPRPSPPKSSPPSKPSPANTPKNAPATGPSKPSAAPRAPSPPPSPKPPPADPAPPSAPSSPAPPTPGRPPATASPAKTTPSAAPPTRSSSPARPSPSR